MKKTNRLTGLAFVLITVFSLCGCRSEAHPHLDDVTSFVEAAELTEESMVATDVTVVENSLETITEDVTETVVDVEKPEETTENVNPSVADKEPSIPSEPKQPKPENEVEGIVPVQHNHVYTKTVTKEASCTSIGKIRYECGCGYSYLEDIPQKQHNYLSQVVPATCTKAGYTEYRCKNCTDSYKGNETLATGHFWSEWRVDKKATITSAGIQSRSCSSCDKQETKEIEKIPHGHVYTGKVIAQAKCEETGVKTFSCSCGDSYTQLLPAMGHSWSDWKVTKEESEKESGCKERSCEVCGKGESLEIPKVEHTHSMTHILKKPTCTEEGYTTHKCSICPYTYTDSKVAAKGHSFSEWITVVDPTETAEGLAKRTCSACSTYETKTLGKKPASHVHSYTATETVSADCTKDGYVKRSCSCGDAITEVIPASHHWKKQNTEEMGHWETYIVCHCSWRCSAEGDYITAFANHVNSIDAETRYDHSYYDTSEWIVDIPAKEWMECTVCGTAK